MNDDADPRIQKLRGDLTVVHDRMTSHLEQRGKQLREIPDWALESYLEEAKHAPVVRRENEALQSKLATYSKGPLKRKQSSIEHVKNIAAIMADIRDNSPERSEATIRKIANKQYGKLMVEQQLPNANVPFYRDDAYLRRMLRGLSKKAD
ncbi:hypothetical protein ACEWPL_015145 [Roseovarius sp. S1116L3]|uniref:hypothetical protein n=1 Tax=Roseovarius roseus TaxID=3342636 RepID=UPI00372A05FB